jgi:hypothetical protein
MRFAWLILLAACAPRPTALIFDSDFDSDCDDVGALAMLHALADLGEAEIVATMASTQNPDSPRAIDAVNTWYGRPSLPIGAPKGKGVGRKSKYAGPLTERFPNDVGIPPDAARLYRELLMKRPDRSVTIVTVGYHTNLADLLRLPAEEGMPSGREVAERKVRLWACMGGNFVGRPAKDDLKLGNVNFTTEKEGAYFALRNWPGPITFVGREIGSVPSGLKAGARLRELPESNPVRVAYALYFGGEPKDRHVADQTAVLFAVRGRRGRWDEETAGRLDLRPDMTFEWRTDRDSEQSYLLKPSPPTDRAIEREIEDLMMRPPGATSAP